MAKFAQECSWYSAKELLVTLRSCTLPIRRLRCRFILPLIAVLFSGPQLALLAQVASDSTRSPENTTVSGSTLETNPSVESVRSNPSIEPMIRAQQLPFPPEQHYGKQVMIANAVQWSGFVAATLGGKWVEHQCKVEDAVNGVPTLFGTAPGFGMPSHYARNAIGVNAGVSLVSYILWRKHHGKAATVLSLTSGAGQFGIFIGDRMGSCN